MPAPTGGFRAIAELDFTVADYRGTTVLCAAGRWLSKVEANHPELSGRMAEVERVIEAPEVVLQDRDYGNRLHHISRDADGYYLTAVVEYLYTAGTAEGHLVTAFVRSRLRSNDTPVYVNARR